MADYKQIAGGMPVKKVAKNSVDYRGEHAMPTTKSPAKKGKKSPAKPILKKKMEDMKSKGAIKTKGQKGKI